MSKGEGHIIQGWKGVIFKRRKEPFSSLDDGRFLRSFQALIYDVVYLEFDPHWNT